eukprot:SAG31_NODE_3711_length_3960_cov_5.475265_4_plen_136_part_00
MLLSRFFATIREIRDFNREKYGTNRESVTLQALARAAYGNGQLKALMASKTNVIAQMFSRDPATLTQEDAVTYCYAVAAANYLPVRRGLTSYSKATCGSTMAFLNHWATVEPLCTNIAPHSIVSFSSSQRCIVFE